MVPEQKDRVGENSFFGSARHLPWDSIPVSTVRPYLRDLVGFAEHKHDPAFVQQLCQDLNEEAMNVIKEIKTLIAELDNKSANPV